MIPWLLSSPPFLSSLRSFTSVWQHPSVAESWKQQGADRRTDGERRRSPWGFLTLFLSPTLSHQISISFSLIRLLDPSSSLFFSLSVPLNLSLVFAHFVSAHSFSSSLSHSVPSFPCLLYSSSLFFSPNSTSPAHKPSLCFPHSFFSIAYILLHSHSPLTSPTWRATESLNPSETRKCCTVGLCVF